MLVVDIIHSVHVKVLQCWVTDSGIGCGFAMNSTRKHSLQLIYFAHLDRIKKLAPTRKEGGTVVSAGARGGEDTQTLLQTSSHCCSTRASICGANYSS